MRNLLKRVYWAVRRAALPFYPPPEDNPPLPETAAGFYKILLDPERVPLRHWQYKGTKEWHIGPSAQQWRRATGLGRNDRTIFPTDVSFAMLAALRHAEKEHDRLNRRVAALEKQLSEKPKKASQK